MSKASKQMSKPEKADVVDNDLSQSDVVDVKKSSKDPISSLNDDGDGSLDSFQEHYKQHAQMNEARQKSNSENPENPATQEKMRVDMNSSDTKLMAQAFKNSDLNLKFKEDGEVDVKKELSGDSLLNSEEDDDEDNPLVEALNNTPKSLQEKYKNDIEIDDSFDSIDREAIESCREYALSKNYDVERGKELVNIVSYVLQKTQELREKQADDRIKSSMDAIKQHRELGGENFKETADASVRILKFIGSKDTKSTIYKSGLLGDPYYLKFIRKVDGLLRDDSISTGTTGSVSTSANGAVLHGYTMGELTGMFEQTFRQI